MRKILCLTLLIAICMSSTSCLFLPSIFKKDKDKQENKISADVDEDEDEDKDEDKEDDDSSDLSLKDPADQPEGGIVFEKDFGTFSIPEGWEESESHSTSEKLFYIPEGNDDKSYTDNISVSYSENKYSEDDVMDFKDAIMEQLAKQMSDYPDATMYGDGSYTANDYLLLSFTISGFEDESTIKIYYIIGEKKHCEIYMTCKDDPEEAQAAVQMMVDSFVWAQED